MVVPAHIDRAALDPVELLQDLVLTSSQLGRDIGESVGKFSIIMLSSQLGSPIAGQPVLRPPVVDLSEFAGRGAVVLEESTDSLVKGRRKYSRFGALAGLVDVLKAST